ncbi:MAG: response regulator transcription factor [Janthinobacterium lividum]
MKILIVEDEPELAASLVSYLQGEQYVCEVASTFDAAEEKMSLFDYDCILLDLTLPGGDGLELLRQLQARHRADGVIITSARDALDDRVTGLKLGADDYLPKPFHLSELSARVGALVRRRRFNGANTVVAGPLAADVLARTVLVRGQPLALTRSEFDLLLLLLSNQHRVVMKSTIAEHVSGDLAEHFDSFEPVYTHVKNLKRKLAEHGLGECIRTVYRLGYRFELLAA